MLAPNEKSTTRRTFVRLVGALTSFVVFVKCKTVGGDSSLRADDPVTAGFLDASKALTGFTTLDVVLGAQYLADMKLTFGDDQVNGLVDAYKQISTAGGDVEQQITDKIMNDAALSKVASGAIMLWYYGTFNKLKPDQAVGVKAYQKGLVWQTFKGKPMGVPGEEEGSWGVEPSE